MWTSAGIVELAGWWRRLGGYVVDAVLVDVAEYVVARLVRAVDIRVRGPLSPGLHALTPGAQATIVVIALAIVVGYPVIMLRHGGQTLGMMAFGVRAVDRDSGGPLTTRQAWRRALAFLFITALWLQVSVVIDFNNVVGPTPVSESIFRALAFIGLLVTGFWPLGSGLSQTLQDKAAETIVVRSRRSPVGQLA